MAISRSAIVATSGIKNSAQSGMSGTRLPNGKPDRRRTSQRNIGPQSNLR
jgi:hypothetical protein